MKEYKGLFPEVSIKYKSGTIKKAQITSSAHSYKMFKELFDADLIDYREEVIAIFLNRRNNTIAWNKVSSGGISSVIVDVRMVLKVALDVGASSIILSHNHPSQDARPSKRDIEITKELNQACKTMKIKLLDHIIITSQSGYYSFCDEGEL